MTQLAPLPLFLDLGLPPPFRAVVSTRAGGVSPEPWASQNHGTSTGDSAERVAKNRELLASSLGLETAAWARVSQVHGARVVQVSAPGPAGEADGLWTERAGLVLAVSVADCAAVAVAHPGSGRLGLAHAGWRGAAAHIEAALIRAMEVPAAECFAAISPCLGPCCFEVGPEVALAFGGRFSEPRGGGGGDRSSLHLEAALAAELEEAGIPSERIRRAQRCTACGEELFFSHRRDRGRTGRLLALAWRAP